MHITNDHLNLAWAAGLFDGEGSVTYKKYKEKKRNGTYDCWRIAMEVSMTDEPTIRVLHDILKVGTVNKKPRDKTGHKMQWRWRCVFRDAYFFAIRITHDAIQDRLNTCPPIALAQEEPQPFNEIRS